MDLFTILLYIHIAGGGLSLLLGLYIVLVKKGNNTHRVIGKIYFIAMLVAAVVSLPMAFLHPNYFLFLIGIFTSYMLLTGTRYLKKKTIKDVKPVDWLLTVVMLLFGVSFIGFGIYHIVSGQTFGVVFCVFGGLGLLFAYQDRVNFQGKSKVKNFFLTTHLQRMMGSYIASVTAFLVVNNTILPGIVVWLLPTVCLVPLITRWSRKYQVVKSVA